MKSETHTRHTSAIAPLLLFVIFTICILSVLLAGTDVYRKLSYRDQNSFQHRTVAQYLTTRIHQSDVIDAISVGDFSAISEDRQSNGTITGDTLILREEIHGRIYHTRIYCYEGYLRELFSPAGLDFSPQNGERILEVQDLCFTLQNRLLSIEITYTDNSTETLHLSLHSGEEVAP